MSAALTIVLLGMAGLMSGCSGDSTGPGGPIAGSAPASGAPAAPAWQPFDPPTRFDSSKGVTLPDGVVETNVLLHGTVAYAGMADGLVRVDLPTGQQAAPVLPTRPAFTFAGVPDGVRSTPVLADLAGRQVVVLPMLVTVPAVGTNPESNEVDLIVADAATGKAISVLQIDLEDDDISTLSLDGMQVRVIGVRGSLVVLAAGERVALAVDLAAGRVSWRQANFQPTALIGDTVVGESPAGATDKSEVLGLALATGQRAWKALPRTVSLNLSEAGPNFVMATGDTVDSGFFVLIRPDGSLAARNKGKYLGMTCRYDAKASTVCFSTHGRFAFALDSTSFKVLWTMPQEGSRRTVPKVTTAWHGVVYGRANDQAVILDARTGVDRTPAPDISPQVVNAHAGLHTTGAIVTAYPAIG